MPADSSLASAAVVLVFVALAVVLAWADFQSMRVSQRQTSSARKRRLV